MQRNAHRNAKGFLLIFLTILLVLATLKSSLAVFHTKVGVKAGDWAKYGDIKVTWNSNDPNAQPEPRLINANATEWFNITVLEIIDTVIRFQNTTALKNGTLITRTALVDIETGTGEAYTFISADLSAGDPLYSPEQGLNLIINETITRTYSGASRDVNYLNLTNSYTLQNDFPTAVYISLSYYWDKATGILVERRGTFVNQTGSYITSWSRSDKLLETNLWSPSEETPPPTSTTDNTLWIIGGVAVVTITIIIFWKRQRKARFKPSRRRRR